MQASETRQMGQAALLCALVLLLGLHPVASYLYLPALPLLKEKLGISDAQAQLTLSILVLSFGFGQILWGPVADRLGRRRVLLLGLGMLLVASLFVTFTSQLAVLLVGRVFQGLGIAAAGVCARAIVRDCFQPVDGIRMLSLAFSWLGLISLAGPLLGASLIYIGGFRAALGTLILCSALALIFIAFKLPETVPAHESEQANIAGILKQFSQILRHPLFLSYAALTAFSYAGHYFFLSLSPFVFTDLYGLDVLELGYLFSISSLVHLAGTFACRQWLAEHGIRKTLKMAGLITLAGGVAIVMLNQMGWQSIWAILLPQSLFLFAHAIHQSCGQSAVSAPFSKLAATASSLCGFLITAVAILLGEILKASLPTGREGMVDGIAICALLTTAVAWTWVQRYGDIAGQVDA
ncbi:Bcr/CflA family efflux MFS transporter [Undibacterium sp. Ji50W]|uniref:Bcr/CflA family efflux MFS transporter n=1 Tax=Undibacterium sp. Ji50W TaxID=3413041 RepID=UPI003BF43D1F